MIKKIDITNPEIAFDVLRVQLPAYQTEASILNYYHLPPLHDNIDSLLNCGETFYGYYIRGILCGAISCKIKKHTADIHRLIVHPDYFQKGIAGKLLEFLEDRNKNIDTIIVATAAENNPAINFYIKNGFTKTSETKVEDGLILAHFKKNI